MSKKQENDQQIFERLLKEKMDLGGPFEFDGWNCHDVGDDWNEGVPCDGWDGESRRCNCGNRRVSWVLSDCKNYIYGEAY